MSVTDNITVAQMSHLTNTTESLGLMEKQPTMTTIMIVLYVLIFIAGVVGNILVLIVIGIDKTMQTITNKFIACLSVSDLLICCFAIPFTPLNALGKSWTFGGALCKLVPVSLLICVFVSTLTSVMIAVDRYIVIIHPYAKRMSGNIQAIIVLGIWLLASLTAVPIGIYTAYEESQDGKGYDCHERWPDNNAATVYTWLIFTLQVVIPGIIITICYTAIGVTLRRRTRKKYNNNNKTTQMQKEKAEISRNRRINRMLIAMIVIFLFCWLPLDLIHVANKLMKHDRFLTLFLFCHILAMSSVVYNPILYGCLNEKFNKGFRNLFRKATKYCRRFTKDNMKNSSDQGSETLSNPTKATNLTVIEEREDNAEMLEEKQSDCSATLMAMEETKPMLPQNNIDNLTDYAENNNSVINSNRRN